MNATNSTSTFPALDETRRLHDLSGRVAVVTGGSGGLGRAIAWGFACHGADVAILDLDLEAGRAAAAEISSATGRKVSAYHANMSDEPSVEGAIAMVGANFGAVNILVNGAGHNIRKPLVDFSLAEFDSLHAVHVRGAFLACRSVGRSMRERQSGSIINIASIAGQVGMPNVSAYAAAKGALIQLTKSLALEMAPFGVRVNAISPGYIDTPLTRQHVPEERARAAAATPMKRFGRPGELIGPAVFLASDASSFVTGTSLLVDGGWTAQ